MATSRLDQLTNFQLRDENGLRLKRAKNKFRQKDAKDLLDALDDAVVEKDVENAWRKAFSIYYRNLSKGLLDVSSPVSCDGYVSPRVHQLSLYHNSKKNNITVFDLRILMEFKQKSAYKKLGGGDLRKPLNRVLITIQLIHYMKKMEHAGIDLPTVLVGADQEEAFILLAPRFYKYLKRDYNWNCEPNKAWTDDPKLFKDLIKDANLNIFPFQFNKKYHKNLRSFKQEYKALLELFISIDMMGNNSEMFHVPINSSNILDLYSQFTQVAYRGHPKITSVESVNLFMQLITKGDPTEYYFIDGTNIFHLPKDKKVRVYRTQIMALLNRYDRNLKPSEIDKLKGIADRLIEAEERRRKGDFWTPTIWAKQANKLMEKYINKDYKNNSLIWDCAAGVRNLTRPFIYHDLFISTYHPAEILLGKGYNPEAKAAFTYDFLNDDVKLNPKDNPITQWKMPHNLFKELIKAGKTNKRVIFYTNPPFGTANNAGAKGTSKKNISKTIANKLMKNQGYGSSSQQLYAQFFFRITKLVHDFHLKNVYIAFFSKATFFSGGRYWKRFNRKFFSQFKFIKGMMIRSDEFSGTADYWPIIFAIYKLRDNKIYDTKKLDNLHFHFNIYKSYLNSSNKLDVKLVGNHTMQTVYDNTSLSSWAKAPIKNYSKHKDEQVTPYPELANALNVSAGKNPVGVLYYDSLGYMVLNSNNVAENSNGVWIVSSTAYKGHGLNIMPNTNSLNRAVVAFTARRSIKQNWVIDQDKYRAPNFSLLNDKKSQFINDCMIYTLFNNASYQASYRNPKWTNINVPGLWANKWFWLSNSFVLNYANNNHNQIIYNDARTGKNSYIYSQLQKRVFSNEAINVLNDATQVWKDTFGLRNVINDTNPNLYLNTWDAGWYQIKQIPQTKHLPSFKIFQNDYKKLGNKLKSYVYRLGMLNK